MDIAMKAYKTVWTPSVKVALLVAAVIIVYMIRKVIMTAF